MIGTTVAHYKIERKLGEGGMGAVYLALDTKLNRRVALKFLPESLADNPEARARLLREAQAASRLNHPNILTVHSVEEADGRDFIVMEYLEGRPLSDWAKAKPSVPAICEIGRQIAEGLAHAHRADVIHRDIKPDNIIITPDGRAKLMDFGLATWRGAEQLTQDGSTVGTVAYMSPEQASGGTVDRRSDLWSVGVVLYELLTGHTPFVGEHQAAVIYAIANEVPEPLARYKSGLSESMQQMVGRLLEKDPALRYQSAEDLAADLKRSTVGPKAPVRGSRRMAVGMVLLVIAIGVISTVGYYTFTPLREFVEPSSPRPRVMLAVLPFENLGAEENEYFADGITEEITARLAGIQDLGVIARTSILQYKGTQKSVQQIGDELDVQYILEGTIRWEKAADGPGRVRVTPQLINVADATHLWAEVYDEVLTSVFEVQGEIAAHVVEALNLTLLESERAGITRAPTANVDAYDLYLQANSFFNEGFLTERPMRLAAALYEQATARDSQFVAAFARMGRAYIELYWHQGKDPEYLRRAEAALAQARRIAPRDPDLLLVTGSLHYHAGEHDRALANLFEGLQVMPNNSDLLAEIGYVLRRQGRMPEALDYLTRAAELDPLAYAMKTTLADTYTRMKRYDESERLLRDAIAESPDHETAYGLLSVLILMRDGDLDEIVRLGDLAESRAEPTGYFEHFRGLILLATGDYDKALTYFDSEDPQSPGLNLIYQAYTHEQMGHAGQAHRLYDSARVIADSLIQGNPEDPDALTLRAMAYAYLDRSEDAIATADRLLTIVPPSSDPILYDTPLRCAVMTYARAGAETKALDLLDELLARPILLSRNSVRIFPFYRVLDDNPRFQALTAGGS